MEEPIVIISHKYRFIFIKTAKTAGTSLEVYLSRHCGDDDIVTPIYPHVDPHKARNYTGRWNPARELLNSHGHGILATVRQWIKGERFYNHIPARVARTRMKEDVWNSYYKFCIERNPWDKTLSHYHMLRKRSGGKLSFEEYLGKGNFCVNYPLYTDLGGGMLMDKIARYESLDEELEQIFKILGIPFKGALRVRAKSDTRKDRRPYQEVYTREQRETVDEAFSEEIAMHGYEY